VVNQSRNPISIRSIKSSCNCVEAKGGGGAAIAPGQGRDLSFLVNYPDAGTSSARIEVFHDGGPQPLVVHVAVTGRGSVPAITAVRNAEPAFHALSSTAEQSEIWVETREAIDSDPWVSGLECDVDCVRITLSTIRETRSASGYLDRVYTYRVVFRELPGTSGFGGDIWLVRRDPASPRLKIGHLSGSLGSPTLISPAVIEVCSLRECRQAIALAPNTGRWNVAPGTALPVWLTARWEMMGGDRRLLIVAAEHGKSANSTGVLAIPLVSDSGMKANLTVVSFDSK
jgi:hypothetical protein